MSDSILLTSEERATYEWQMWVPDFGEEGQRQLKRASVLISRIGGLGGVVAYQLAAAGIGRLILAHAGNVKQSDLNRQLLMTHNWVGLPRVDSARRRLQELNPRLEVECLAENVSAANAEDLVAEADLVVDCAPLFEERYELNRQAVAQRKPLVECAMYDMEFSVTTIQPGRTPCLSCIYPTKPPAWRREFPVFGAVSGAVGCMAAAETIKVIAGLGEPLYGQMLTADLREMSFRKTAIKRNADCPVCRAV
jgi:molybdopterin/thiamine biosynthesis adenylyltransferase